MSWSIKPCFWFQIYFIFRFQVIHSDSIPFTLTEQGMESLSFYLNTKLSSAQSGCVAREQKIPFVRHLGRRGFFSHEMQFWIAQHQACGTLGTEGSFDHHGVLWLQIQTQIPCLPYHANLHDLQTRRDASGCSLCNLSPSLLRFSRSLDAGKCTQESLPAAGYVPVMM